MQLGADAVGLGRAFLYGMSSYGQAGVEKVIDILQEELVMAMRMMGVVSIDELKRQGPGLVITKSLSQHSGSAPRDHLADQVYERLALTKSLSNL